MKITKEVVSDHGITEDEYQKIISILGREPNFTELGIFSVMWSEHCSYKSSRKFLGTFPTEGPLVIHGPGENAGVIDVGEGYAAVFKMESHNHPSFIEPYEGAATGVGGILRDVFTMGARPVALLNSLRFGSPDHPGTRFLLNGVVSGIAGYGNCVGVPNVGGETGFDKCFNGNILVNVFCLGLARKDKIFLGKAAGVGNPVIYVGSKTGRDGIHGATMASGEFDEKSEEQRPTVQVGDPFTEKLLIEACLEAMKTDYIVGIQDMGAAGLTSSSCEMAGRAGNGIDMDVSKIPVREEGMTPYEILLSESQERMLIVSRKGCEEKLCDIFRKWDLDAVTVGEVTDDGNLRIRDKGEVVAEIPALAISENAPRYDRPSEEPAWFDELKEIDTSSVEIPKDLNGVLLKLLGSLNIASKASISRQYDSMVRTNTVILPGSDAAVIRIKGTDRGIAVTSDCNSRYCYLDPFEGGKIAVSEAARNVVCSGGRPAAITDNLNFGNPEKPEVMWQIKESIRGISEACRALDVPVVSGNVSLYNETKGEGIYPTPTIGMVGIVGSLAHVTTQWFKGEGDIVYLLGENRDEAGASEYLSLVHGVVGGKVPSLDTKRERDLQTGLLAAIESGIILSAHDCSEGGLAVTIAESCISGPLLTGAEIDISEEHIRIDTLLFGETQSRVIVTIKEKDSGLLESLCKKHYIAAKLIGITNKNHLSVKVDSREFIHIGTDSLRKVWSEALPAYMEQET